MSGDARDFNNIKKRDVIKFFFFFAKQGDEVNSRHLKETLWEHAPLYATIKKWVAHFNCGDAPRPGRLKTVTTPEIIVHIHKLILEDRRI